jgi:mRNA interferase HicA
MKRTKLERHLRENGCRFDHHGGKHDIWVNPATGSDAPVPRHADIKKWTARAVCVQLGIPVPPGS